MRYLSVSGSGVSINFIFIAIIDKSQSHLACGSMRNAELTLNILPLQPIPTARRTHGYWLPPPQAATS